MASKFKLSWDQKQARDALGIKQVNKQREVDAINAYIASQNQPKAQAPAPAPAPAPTYSYNVTPQGSIDNSPGMTREQASDYMYQSGLITLQGNISQELEKLRGVNAAKVAEIGAGATVKSAELDKAARERVAEIASGATIRSAELDKEARMYLADKDYLAQTDVAKIKGQNDLDLQAIINTGLKEVESIRQEGGKDIARITGEFGVKQEETRQKGQKDIANIGSASSLRNALVSAFSF